MTESDSAPFERVERPFEPPPLAVVAGGLGLGYALAAQVLDGRLGGPGDAAWIGAVILLTLSLAVGVARIHRLLGPFVGHSAAPAFAALAVLPLGLPPISSTVRLGSLAIPIAIGVVAAVTGIRHLVRTGREVAAWDGLLLLAPAALLWPLVAAEPAPTASWYGLIFAPLIAFLLTRLLGLSAAATRAALVPIAALPVAVLSVGRFWDGDRLAGGFDIPAVRWSLVALTLLGVAAVVIVERRGARPTGLADVRILLRWVALPLLVFATSFDYRVHDGPITPQEGAALASLTAWDAGARPYGDLQAIDGVGDQLVRPWLAGEIFGRSLRGLRLLTDLLEPLDHAVLMLVAVAVLPARWSLLFFLLVAVRVLPMPADGRALLAHLALLALVTSVERPRLAVAAACGTLAGVAALLQPHAGSSVLIAGTVVYIGLAARDRKHRLALAYFVPGWVIGAIEALPWLDLSVVVSPLPWPYLLGLAAALAGVVACVASIRGRLVLDRGWRVLSLTAAVVMLVLTGPGRPTVVAELGSLAVLLLMLLVSQQLRFEAPIGVMAVALLCVPVTASMPPFATLLTEFRGRPDVSIAGKSLVQLGGAADRSARVGVLLPEAEARRIAPAIAGLSTVVGSDRRFFDFTDNAVLHFATDMAPPTRIATLSHAGPLGVPQGAVVSDLARDPPRVVLFRAADGDPTDGVDRLGRYDVIASYLVRHYRPSQTLGGFLLLARVDPRDPGDGEPIPAVVELGELPLERGAALDLRQGTVHERLSRGRTGDAVVYEINQELRRHASTLRVGVGSGAERLVLSWTAEPSGVRCEVRFDADVDNDATYAVPVSALPCWVWPRRIRDLQLRTGSGEPVVGELALEKR